MNDSGIRNSVEWPAIEQDSEDWIGSWLELSTDTPIMREILQARALTLPPVENGQEVA